MKKKLAIKTGLKGIKPGDKLICKLDFLSKTGLIYFKSGNIYQIESIIEVNSYNFEQMVTEDTKGLTTSGLYKISVSVINHSKLDFFNFFWEDFEFYIWKYFYTETELRKEKLLKLKSLSTKDVE